MEQKKFDPNSLIGFVLLGAIALWWMYSNQPTPEELEQQKTERIQDSINAIQKTIVNPVTDKIIEEVPDSIAQVRAQNELGVFAQSASVSAGGTTVIENAVLKLTIANKGGQIIEAHLKEFNTYDSIPVKLQLRPWSVIL